MVPPPNAEGVPGVQAVLTVAQISSDQVQKFIDYEGTQSIDDLKTYADRDTVIALVSALSKTRPVGDQVSAMTHHEYCCGGNLGRRLQARSRDSSSED